MISELNSNVKDEWYELRWLVVPEEKLGLYYIIKEKYKIRWKKVSS